MAVAPSADAEATFVVSGESAECADSAVSPDFAGAAASPGVATGKRRHRDVGAGKDEVKIADKRGAGLEVRPGQRVGVQTHRHRGEHGGAADAL